MSGKFEFSLLGNPKLGFASVLIFVFLIVGSVALGYVFVKNTISVVYFQKAITAINTGGNIDSSESALLKAVSLKSERRVLPRSFADFVSRINSLFQQKDIKPEDARTQFTPLWRSHRKLQTGD